jgi:hypothetical protein
MFPRFIVVLSIHDVKECCLVITVLFTIDNIKKKGVEVSAELGLICPTNSPSFITPDAAGGFFLAI